MLPLRRLLPLFFLLPGVLAIASNSAVADDEWLNQRVYLKVNARPKVGNRTLDWNDVTMPAKITKVDGDWLWVGSAWVRRNEVVKQTDGTTYYTRVVRENPRHAGALLLRGVTFHLKRDYANAIKDFTEVIRIEPTAHSAYCARASSYYALQEFDKSLADLTEAIRLAPEVAVYYNDRGCSYRGRDSYQKSTEEFDEAIRLDPNLSIAYSNRGVNWLFLKDYDRAMADFDKAIKIDARNSFAYDGRGYVWSKRGHYNQALKDWDDSIRVAPEEPGGHYNKARLYATCMSVGHRDGQMAVESARKACELNHWEEWRYVSVLAAAYAELGNFDEAVQWQKKAIAMNKDPEPVDVVDLNARLALYEAGMPFRDPEVSEQTDGTE
jgi:tetratricopeptide (TPR) repeat protein